MTVLLGAVPVPVRTVTSITDGPLAGIGQVVFGLPVTLRGAGT